MVRLAAIEESHLCGRVRCRSARPADVTKLTEPFRFFPAQGTDTLRTRATQWRFALAARLCPTRKSKGMDLRAPECLSISALRSLHLSLRDRDHRCFVSSVFRICRI